MEFSRQEYWSGWPFPSSGDLLDSGIKPRSPALQADSLPSEPQGTRQSQYSSSGGILHSWHLSMTCSFLMDLKESEYNISCGIRERR